MRNQDWDIKPRGSFCVLCKTAFADQQPYLSSLRLGAQGFERGDFCRTCWPQQDSTQALSVWHGVFHAPAPLPEEALKKETAESMLRTLIEQNDSGSRNTIFILAVMLERRKWLVEKNVRRLENGSLLRIYEHRKTGDTYVISDPQLSLDQIEKVQEEVVALLGGKPNPSPEAQVPAPTPQDPPVVEARSPAEVVAAPFEPPAPPPESNPAPSDPLPETSG